MRSKELLENVGDNSESNERVTKKKLENQKKTLRIIQKYFVIEKQKRIMDEISQ